MAIIKLRGFKGQAVVPVASGCLEGHHTFFAGQTPRAGRYGTLWHRPIHEFRPAVQYGKFGYPDAMVMHMSTQKGESGGPVFDDRGRLAGMVVSTLSDGNGASLNLAHAVPSATLAKFLCSSTNCSANWAALALR